VCVSEYYTDLLNMVLLLLCVCLICSDPTIILNNGTLRIVGDPQVSKSHI